MKGINPIAAQIANSPAAKLGAKLANSPAAKAAMQMTNNPMVKAAAQISRIAQPYAEALQKFSSIEWIGKMPMNWELARMKNVGEYINGYAFKPDDWSNYGLPIIRIQDLTGSSENPNYYDGVLDDKYKVLSGDILISWAATLDAFTWTKHTGWLNQHIFKAIPNTNKIEKKFFIFLAKEAMQHMNNDNKHGIVMQHVTLGVFNNFKVPLPPLSEQQAIADYLDGECARIDGIVTTQRQIIERLKEYKKSVISEAVTRGLNPDVPMKDSGIEWIGKIPEYWEISKLKYYSKYITDGTHTTPEYLADGVPFLSIKDISAGKLDFSNTKHISQQQHEELSKHAPIEKGDILFTRIGTLGVSVIVETDIAFDIFVSVGLLKPKDNINTKYLNYVMNSEYYYQYIQLVKAGEGTSAAKFNLSDVSNSPIVCPPLSEQQAIADYLDRECARIDTIIEKRERMIELMTEYKKSLIYECVTGKKEIVDVVG